jgi:hypothetical protein
LFGYLYWAIMVKKGRNMTRADIQKMRNRILELRKTKDTPANRVALDILEVAIALFEKLTEKKYLH